MMVIGKKYINAENQVIGRLASKVAKLALMGYEIYIFNAEKSVITGDWYFLVKYWNHKVNERGDWLKGPFYPTRPDKILRRVIRGMLPKNYRGRIALKRVKVFLGVPEEYKNVTLETFKDADITERIKKSKRRIKYYYLIDISKQIGYNPSE